MAELNEFKVDTKAINDGIWVRVNEAAYGDLEIRSRGFTDEFIDAQNARMAKAAESYANDRTRIPNAESRSINASLLEDFLVIDVRNLTDAGRTIPVAEFHEMLYEQRFHKLARACWDAAQKITTRSEAQAKAAEGNSPTPSASTSTGAPSASA